MAYNVKKRPTKERFLKVIEETASTKEAAKALGCCHCTMLAWYDLFGMVRPPKHITKALARERGLI